MIRRARLMLWALVALAALVGGLLWLRAERPVPDATTSMAGFGGPFSLTRSDGRRFGSAELSGRPYALFFGFTHCPDVCPTTLARLVALRRRLGAGDRAFEILFVTVDPERDGAPELKRYEAMFDAPLIALRGTTAQTEAVKKTFGIYSAKVAAPDGGYSIDHSAAVLLFGADGQFAGTIAPDEDDGMALEKLKRLAA
jgi:protein SCO1/2